MKNRLPEEVWVVRVAQDGTVTRTKEMRDSFPVCGGDDEIDQLKFEDRETLKPRRAPWEE